MNRDTTDRDTTNHEPGAADLSDLSRVELAPRYEAALQRASGTAGGDRVWRERKVAEGRDLCALASLAPRMSIENLSLDTDLVAIVRLQMPVPCRFGDGDLVVAGEAVLGIRYPREALLRPLPGTAFVQVLRPLGAFVPTVADGPVQVACLGDKLPAGIRVTELVLLAFRSLALQDHTIDERDPAGVFRADAARFYQEHPEWLPLTDEPFVHAVGDQAEATAAEVGDA
jgi:hypothetical protein